MRKPQKQQINKMRSIEEIAAAISTSFPLKKSGTCRVWGRGGNRKGLTKNLCYDIIKTEVVNGGAIMR